MSQQGLRRCVVCQTTKNLKQCCSNAKLYCGEKCQLADWKRHKITCLIGTRQTTEKRLPPEEVTLLRKFELLLDRSAQDLLAYSRSKETMELVYFILDTQIVNVLLKIPTRNNLRAQLLTPLLKSRPSPEYIYRLIRSYGFGENFLEALTYKESDRVLVDMRKFWTYYGAPERLVDEISTQLYSPKTDPRAPYVVREKFGIFRDRQWAIPFIRYQTGDTGLYAGTNDGRFLGTFAYFEPQSAAMIIADKVLVAGNKISAMRHLGVPYEEVRDLMAISPNSVLNPYPIDSELPAQVIPGGDGTYYMARHFGFNLDVLNTEWEETQGDSNAIQAFTDKWWPEILRVFYVRDVIEYENIAMTSSMYCTEDLLDQPLAKAALENDIEVVILTNMAGKVRQATEVLDVRTRPDMFKNLVVLH